MTTTSSSTKYPPLTIIGIGMSSEETKPLEAILSELPAPLNAAVVVIWHPASNQVHHLPEIITKKNPPLEFIPIKNGLKLRAGTVFFAPPEKEVTLAGGSFRVGSSRRQTPFPIDAFFSSLAEYSAGQVIALLLSGDGGDGLRGAMAIRNSGGTVLVQDPATTMHPYTPSACVVNGSFDAVLDPGGIGSRLSSMIAAGSQLAAGDDPPQNPSTLFELLRQHSEFPFDAYKQNVVLRRVQRRMGILGSTTLDHYTELLHKNPDEADRLAADMLIGVTCFFRDGVVWDNLKSEVIEPLVLAKPAGDTIRIWVPACSTGEEAYTVAMLLQQAIALSGKKIDFQVFATDLSEISLRKAREGCFAGSYASDIPPEYLQACFTRSVDGHSLQINNEPREHLVFARQNLLVDPPFSKLDMIVCRNLLIYLTPEAQEKCIALFHFALKPNGCLMLGNAESVGRQRGFFKPVGSRSDRIYARSSMTKPLFTTFATAAAKPVRQGKKQIAQVPSVDRDITGFTHELLLAQYAPPAVTLNSRYEILALVGQVERFLRPPSGRFSKDIIDWIPQTMRIRFRSLLYNAAQGNNGNAIAEFNFPVNDNQALTVKVHVGRHENKIDKSDVYLVAFEEQPEPGVVPLPDAPGTTAHNMAIRQIEGQLAAVRDDLQVSIEEHRSANEELQASNEELQAANEELETSREEMQSLNEELLSANDQLKSKIDELESTSNDLSNFFSSTDLPMLFLDAHMQVKRFTPAIGRLINLVHADIGRPIIDLSPVNLGDDLAHEAKAVLASLKPVHREMVLGGICYIRHLLPYRTSDNRIEGVVATYTDITELKRVEEEVRSLARFPEENSNPVMRVSREGVIMYANPASRPLLSVWQCGVQTVLTGPLQAPVGGIVAGNYTETEITTEVACGEQVFAFSIVKPQGEEYINLYGRDITVRKKAETALQESETRYRTIVQTANEGICQIDAQGEITFCNDTMARMLGYTAGEIVGRSTFDFMDEAGKNRARETIEKRKQGIAGSFEQNFVRKDGTTVWMLSNGAPLLNAQGVFAGSLGMFTDITDRKNITEAIQKSEQTYRLLVNSIPDTSIMLFDKDLRYQVVGGQENEKNNFDRSQIEGRTLRESYPKEVADLFEPIYQKALSGEVTSFEMSYGNFSYLQQTIPVKDPLGHIFGAMQISTNITGRKKAEEALRESEEKYRLMFTANPSPMFVFDEETLRFLAVNEAAVVHYGWTREEFLALSVLDIRPDGEKEMARAVIDRNRGSHDTSVGVLHHCRKDGTVRDMEIFASSIDFAGRPGRLCLMNDITNRKQIDDTLRFLVQHNQQLSNEDFFVALAEYLAHSLEMDYICIDKLHEDLLSAETVAVYYDGKFEDNVSYTLADTPCGAVVDQKTCCFTENVRNLFPKDAFLQEMRAEGYLGTILWSARGKPIGLIALISRCPIVNPDLATSILTLVGVRAAAELERRQNEFERNAVIEFLHLVNNSRGIDDLIKSSVKFFRETSGFDAVGIRLKKGEDFPYYETKGFTDEFVLKETNLCSRDDSGEIIRDKDFNPVIECMCGNVICDRFDASKPFFTPKGSFWSNCTTDLLASTTDADRKARTRNRCNGEGYESVGLFALRSGKDRLGLVQLNDRRKGMFSSSSLALWEKFADYLAVAMAKFIAEDALRDSEERFSKAFRFSPVGINIFRLSDGRSVDVNDAFLRLIGYEREEVIGHTVAEFNLRIDPEIRDIWIKSLMQGKNIQDIDLRIGRKDGRIAQVLFSLSPIEIMNEAMGLVLAVDITDRKKSEEALRESEARFRSALGNIADTFYSLDPEWRFAAVNPAAERAPFGRPAAEMLGKVIWELFPGLVGTPIHQRYLDAVEHLRLEHYEAQSPLNRRWYEVFMQGHAGGVDVYMRDITGRKNAETALTESETKYRRIIETANEGIIFAETDGRITMVNQKMAEMLGYPADEIVGRGGLDFMSADQREKVVRYRKRLGRKTAVEDEFCFIRKDGTQLWTIGNSVPIFDDNGEHTGNFAMHTDITDRKHNEEEREITVSYLRLVNECGGLDELIKKSITFIQKKSGFDAVGIRLEKDGDYPYYETQGFTEDFVLAETQLCVRDAAGNTVRDENFNPVLECMCGNVIQGRYDPSKEFFTRRGSFWSNCTTALLASTTDADRQARTRNRCNGNGYESVGLFALKADVKCLGLLQLNDKRKGQFTLESVALWERLSDYLAVAIAKFEAQEGLIRSRQEWVNTVNSIPDLISIIDNKHRIVRINKAMADKLGITPEEAVGLHCHRCVHGLETPIAACPHTLLLTDGKEHVAEIHETTLGGEFLVSVTPIVGHDGAVTGCVHVARDISELKRRERELNRLNRILSSLGKSSQAMARAEDEGDYLQEICRIIIDDCGHAMVWIGFAENDADKSVRPVASAGFEEGYLETLNISWADTERGRGPTGTAIRTGRPAMCRNMQTDPKFALWREQAMQRGYAASIVLPLMDGTTAFGALSIYSRDPDPFSPEEVNLLLELANDLAYGITALRHTVARRKAEEQLAAHSRELAAANKELESFAYSVSHDLRAPLRTMYSFSGLLMEDYADKLDATGKDYLGRISSGAMKMNTLIDDIMSLSLVSRHEILVEEVNLSEIASTIIDELRSSPPERRAVCVIAPDIRAFADRRLIGIALTNLLQNAWKYSGKKEETHIVFGEETYDGERVFFVRDNGVGFDMQHASRLFTAFARLHRERDFPGTGIGLAIVNRVIARHGGRVWAEGRTGEGACFRFSLPVRIDGIRTQESLPGEKS